MGNKWSYFFCVIESTFQVWQLKELKYVDPETDWRVLAIALLRRMKERERESKKKWRKWRLSFRTKAWNLFVRFLYIYLSFHPSISVSLVNIYLFPFYVYICGPATYMCRGTKWKRRISTLLANSNHIRIKGFKYSQAESEEIAKKVHRLEGFSFPLFFFWLQRQRSPTSDESCCSSSSCSLGYKFQF